MRWLLLACLAHVSLSLTVFVAPHTHLDLDWLYPLEEYYDRSVRFAGDTVVQNLFLSLSASKERRVFNWCETAYLARWWHDRDEAARELLRSLVREGRVGFVGGGWAQNDEALTNWEQVVDNMALGHLFIARSFGPQFVPRLSWQIDPFGASSVVAFLFSFFFDYHVVDRVDYALKRKWIAEKSLEFVWSGGIFAHCLEEHYSSPVGYDFEGSYSDNPQINPKNVRQRADELLRDLARRGSYFRTQNLLLLFGDDFRFVNADKMFLNMDMLMAEINSRNDSGVSVRYALAAEYFDTVVQTLDTAAWPELDPETDLFPYRKDVSFQWYTGFYTTRPQQKLAIVRLAATVRTAAMLVAGVARNDDEAMRLVGAAKEAAARATHHDTLPGTSSNQTVAHMTALLSIATAQAETAARLALGAERAIEGCVSGLPSSLTAVNSLAWPREALLCFAVCENLRSVRVAIRGKQSQRSVSGDTLCFFALLPPMGSVTYFAEMGQIDNRAVLTSGGDGSGGWELRNRFVSAKFDSETGALLAIDNTTVAAKFEVYNTSHIPGNHMSNRYFSVFNSSLPEAPFVSGSRKPRAWRIDGPLFSEVVSEIDANLTLCFRVCSDAAQSRELGGGVVTVATVGPLGWNVDLFLSFVSPQLVDKPFVTDMNGFAARERLVYAPSGTPGGLLQPASVFSSLGPLSLFADRPHAAMAQSGSLRVGLHRRLNCSNSVVLNEPLNDTSVISASFFVSLDSAIDWRRHSLLTCNPPLQIISSRLFSGANVSLARESVSRQLHATLSVDFPENVTYVRLWSWGEEMPPEPEAVLSGRIRGKKRLRLNRVGEQSGEKKVVECFAFDFL